MGLKYRLCIPKKGFAKECCLNYENNDEVQTNKWNRKMRIKQLGK